jgi:hypothetical protein
VLIEQSSRYIAREAPSTVDPGRQVGSIQVYERIICSDIDTSPAWFDESLMEALLDLWQVELEDKWPRASLFKSVIILYDQKTTELARVFGFDDAHEAFIDTGWPFVQERFWWPEGIEKIGGFYNWSNRWVFLLISRIGSELTFQISIRRHRRTVRQQYTQQITSPKSSRP